MLPNSRRDNRDPIKPMPGFILSRCFEMLFKCVTLPVVYSLVVVVEFWGSESEVENENLAIYKSRSSGAAKCSVQVKQKCTS